MINGKLAPEKPADFRKWLQKNGSKEKEVWTVLYKKDSKKQTVTYKELLAEAICFGWIDSRVKSIDNKRFAVRWTPRKNSGNWSNTNIETAKQLLLEGKIKKQGLKTLPQSIISTLKTK